MRNRIEHWFGTLKARTKRFYNNFPNNSTIQCIKAFLETFIVGTTRYSREKLDNIPVIPTKFKYCTRVACSKNKEIEKCEMESNPL
ncbi:hypothetical protein G4O51_09900 [Candidatus Bathyarchaeota archaeon A05DMB-2]|jgi:hypothetical protein|nr:hypothetical protein [Candidatus Bathyarchaeota archaeon A05DMB-2]